ncbi:t-SNARE [Phakopsora pachyrhizi]|uniref:t-SNARE n=1 Tax=Phakopsora pachyrhizi TaxID=170000 RepID=A0AAV0AYI9_PHAPC|nr:t-SNARE [Phakopsora pachyrhizi]KAI8451168.1 t-SNARE [Phakopsora pachyrhizi]CAH7675490.1 t-SNARE [Phakopsora pachyrhizi]
MPSSIATKSQILTRSRTLLFLSYRDTRSSSTYPPRLSRAKGKQKQIDDDEGEEGQALLAVTNSTAVDIEESSALPPKWVDYSEEVDSLLEEIRRKMAQLEKLTAKHVLPGFTDRTSEEREIEALSNEITRGFRKCQNFIRRIADCGIEIEVYIKQFNSRKQPGAEPRYRNRDVTLIKNAQIALATKVQNLSSLFQKRQRFYLQLIRGFSSPPAEKASIFAIEDESHESTTRRSSSGVPLPPNEQRQLQLQQNNVDGYDQDFLETRNKEIEGIAKSISELADMFKDLGNLVLDQGTLLDRIDYNVEQMSNEVKGAAEELKVAKEYQKRSGKCRVIFLLVLLVFAAVLILIYKPRRHSSPSNSPDNPPDTPSISLSSLTNRSILNCTK